MQPPADAVRTVGQGRNLVLIHGTATDASSWSELTRLLQDRVRATTYDRRGTARWPIAAGVGPPSTEDYAADAADVILSLDAGAVHVCGVSFGGTIALELMRRRPELVRGAVLFEPAVPADDEAPSVPTALLAEFERLVRAGRGEQAAEYFHRRMLSDAVWERIPPEVKEQARGMWRHVHYDLLANAAYRVGYSELGGIDVPVLLLRGGRSPAVFEASLGALAAALPQSKRARIEHAGHRLYGRAWRELAAALADFMGA